MNAASRIIAIGDIHGCINALDGLLEVIQPRTSDLIVVLGDFIDQGNETRLVIDRLITLESACRLVCLLGNHEEMLLSASESEEALRYWEVCGGVQTLNSYRFGGNLGDIPAEHWQFVRRCVDSLETDNHMFVHANFDPELALPEQPPHALRWELFDPQTARCHESGKTVVLGHTEQHSGEVLDLGCVKCIDTACWRCGWLTAMEVNTGRIWQASRFGQLRESREPPVGPTGSRSSTMH